ncbi:hypothetical protein DFP73DRAFT_522511 [Morchella snyderi]|nr:hypothetical protein DFP73DRAFT_522511 [Morchella snyderi]
MSQIFPEGPRTRRNSDAASQYSIRSEFSWKELIQPQTRYRETPMATFLGDNALDLVAPAPFDDGSSSDDGEPCERPLEIPLVKQRGRYLSSPVPALDNSSMTTLDSSGLSYISHPHQMYSLQDYGGVLYTRRHLRPVAVNCSPKRGSYRCLFAFNACTEYCTHENWVNHVESHLRGIDPPKSCKCTICGESFETDTPAITWNRFLSHVIDHRYPGSVIPDPEFLEYCTNNDIISVYTMSRADPRPGTLQMARSQEPHMYRRKTPRRFIDMSTSVATVDYPHDWSTKTEGQEPECVIVPERRERIIRS